MPRTPAVDVEVEGGAEALDGGDGAGVRIGEAGGASGGAQPDEDGAEEDGEDSREQRAILSEREAESPGHGQGPLPIAGRGQDGGDEVRAEVDHAAAATRRTHRAALARERDQAIEPAAGAADADETVSELAAGEVAPELGLDVARQTEAMRAALARFFEHRFEVGGDDLMEDRGLGGAAAIGGRPRHPRVAAMRRWPGA